MCTSPPKKIKSAVCNGIAIILMVGFNTFGYADDIDVLKPLDSGDITLNGYIGYKIEKSEENRLKQVNYEELVDPFIDQTEDDYRWRCEFWGKITRSAAASYRYSLDTELKGILDDTVQGILGTQRPDGSISTYPPDKQYDGGWDIWGRKYVFLGLARYYDYVSESSEVLQAMVDAADCIMEHIGPPPKINMIDTGEHEGMASSSILEPFVILYNLTGKPRFLDFAQWIADQGGSTRHDIFEEAGLGRSPKNIGTGKAYEMMSCFEGLAELYRITGNTDYYDSLLTLYENIRDQEIMIHGLGGLKDDYGEYWYDGKLNQTHTDNGRKGETCVTVTWFKFCSHILRLTGDSRVADQMEITMYNALIGAMRPSGEWWTHQNPTLVTGDEYNYKKDAHLQFTDFNQNCCVANGPMALAMIPQYAVMKKKDSGPVINFFAEGTSRVNFDSGSCEYVDLEIVGDYPKTGSITIRVTPSVSCYFTISLRIPEWSAAANTALNVNGRWQYSCSSGSYKELSRTWSAGDEIQLSLDMRGRYIAPPEVGTYGAVMRGPVVLAQDSRISSVGSAIIIEKDDHGYVNLIPVTPGNPDIWMEFTIPPDSSHLCDYASAGNNFEKNNTLCVWIPTATSTGEKSIKCISDNWYARAEGGGDSNGDNIGRNSIKDNFAKWNLIPDGSYYRIKLDETDFYLSGEGPEGSIPNGRNVHLWTWANSDLQRWELIPDGLFYRLRCAEDNMFFSGSGEDSNIHLWQWIGSDLQRWDIQDFTSLESCEGDFDLDGDVDEIDLSVFAADFGRDDCIDTFECSGDFEPDDDVDGKNLSTFSVDFGRTDCP
jgi:DUF1680 family protein